MEPNKNELNTASSDSATAIRNAEFRFILTFPGPDNADNGQLTTNTASHFEAPSKWTTYGSCAKSS